MAVTIAKVASILACGLALSTFAFSAQAFPGAVAPQLVTSDVIQARGFCGLGAHRSVYGYCVPNGVVAVVAARCNAQAVTVCVFSPILPTSPR